VGLIGRVFSRPLESGSKFCYNNVVSSGRKKKDPERYYLFPGQGGKNFYRKQKVFLTWAVILSVLFGTVLALLMWWYSKPKI